MSVVLDVPLPGPFVYRSATWVPTGVRVMVPFGRRCLIGLVVDQPPAPDVPEDQVKSVLRVLDDLPPMPADWLRMAGFAASYYQRPLGEVVLPVLPASLRKVSAYQGQRSEAGPVVRHDKRKHPVPKLPASQLPPAPTLNDEQRQAVAAIASLQAFRPVLLHGVTGSGKTEVYLGAMQAALARGQQVLLLVPEINLTPQLENILRARLASLPGQPGLAVLHSRLAEGARLHAWLTTMRGQASVLLGTRLAIFTPMPKLGLIIIDEEHDTSYKQQEGLRYSARDLAVWRAHDLGIPVVLGSATPSLETWLHAQRGTYHKHVLKQRATAVSMPDIKLIDTRRLRLEQGCSPQLLQAMEERLALGQQCLVFLNRRGYAPVLSCVSCGWLSRCTRCTAYTVLHRQGAGRHELQCHHCGHRARVPRACPDCGDQDLQPMGRGTQRIEEFLAGRFPQSRIARIDADSTRRKGSAEALFAQVHAGEIDILIGTQMVAKGHDFANLGLVGVLNADAMLFAHDFRAPERLFAQLMQVSGRAGRHVKGGAVLLQTNYPEQAVYQALLRHDYEGFADYALREREDIGLPPYGYQALLTAEAKQLATALAFLEQARDWPAQQPGLAAVSELITLYDPVPLRIVRVANVERAQLLVESAHRPALQAYLTAWVPALAELAGSKVRWQLEVDPQQI